MVKILIVDDSVVVRRTLREIFSEVDDFFVVSEANNGKEAVYFAKKFKPDVVTMDIHMPGGGGLEAIEKLVQEFPVPILILTVSSNLEDQVEIFQLLKFGYIDLMEKPSITMWQKDEQYRRRFINKISELAEIGKKIIKRKGKKEFLPDNMDIVGIVSSTGGPKALKELFSNLDPKIRVPIICVQHISPGFSAGLVKWLNSFSKLPIRIAKKGERLERGTIYFSEDDYHIEVNKFKKIYMHQRPPILGLRPAGDFLLSSLAYFGKNAMGIILTGMGSDGKEGLGKMFQNGAYTIAQDKESSIVWGMPKSAIDAGFTDSVLNVKGIINRLNKII